MTGVALTLKGQLASDSAIPWILHRGRLLNLAGWVRREDAETIQMALAGPPSLIDAMEIACSLGPGDVLVETISRTDHNFGRNPKRFDAE